MQIYRSHRKRLRMSLVCIFLIIIKIALIYIMLHQLCPKILPANVSLVGLENERSIFRGDKSISLERDKRDKKFGLSVNEKKGNEMPEKTVNFTDHTENHDKSSKHEPCVFADSLPVGFQIDEFNSCRRDWHDEKFARVESERRGNGEHGRAATLPPNYDEDKYDEVYKSSRYNGLLSDYISVNRSVPDVRPIGCRYRKYRCKLPAASFILPIHNEHWSTLLRTLYSLLNRSPDELIKEIILVDDASTKAHLKKQLDDYVALNLPKVRVLHMEPPRKGLMAARSHGARNASGQVLIFMDAHIEVNANWLPPLLDPIAEDYKTCVCPVLHTINHETFEIEATISEGGRGAFDWELEYRILPLLPEDKMDPTKPYNNPVMQGALFAISSRFFWELGGYDLELQIWGGEQYELSFKIWQCGGTLLDAPCSRVAHMVKGKYAPVADPRIGDYVGRNYKRVAELWMDEYAEYLYMRKAHYRLIDAGDLNQQRNIRKKLNCKPFKWYMEEVAFDIVETFPVIEATHLVLGKIKPLNDDHLCLTATRNVFVSVEECFFPSSDQHRQEFLLGQQNNIQIKGTDSCLNVMNRTSTAAPLSISPCRMGERNQEWIYDSETQQLVSGRYKDLCVVYDDTHKKKVHMDSCDRIPRSQKWTVE